jgi:hypothetical protein
MLGPTRLSAVCADSSSVAFWIRAYGWMMKGRKHSCPNRKHRGLREDGEGTKKAWTKSQPDRLRRGPRHRQAGGAFQAGVFHSPTVRNPDRPNEHRQLIRVQQKRRLDALPSKIDVTCDTIETAGLKRSDVLTRSVSPDSSAPGMPLRDNPVNQNPRGRLVHFVGRGLSLPARRRLAPVTKKATFETLLPQTGHAPNAHRTRVKIRMDPIIQNRAEPILSIMLVFVKRSLAARSLSPSRRLRHGLTLPLTNSTV